MISVVLSSEEKVYKPDLKDVVKTRMRGARVSRNMSIDKLPNFEIWVKLLDNPCTQISL